MINSEYRLSGYRFKRYNESNFVLIFEQKYPIGGLFQDERECNKSHKKNKYSIIGSINDNFKINEYFHFLLEYPELDSYLEFEQKTYITSNAYNVNAKNYNSSFIQFNGLAKSGDANYSCIDGSPGVGTGSWWYSIGTKIPHSNAHIPSPIFKNIGVDVNHVLLWIKFGDIDLLRDFPLISSFCTHKITISRPTAFLYIVVLLLIK